MIPKENRRRKGGANPISLSRGANRSSRARGAEGAIRLSEADDASRARLSALLRRSEIAALVRTMRARGEEGWIVGGAARDLLLGRPHPDVDFAVTGDPHTIARELEQAGVGTAVPLSDASPRVARVAGRRELDLAEVEGGSIAADLARRDFTVNALAIGLRDRAWVDPFGGREALAARRLTMISEQNLRDDPLRTLRAARFLATHGLVPDRATTAACSRAAPLLPIAAPERIRVELEKLLSAPRAVPALAWAGRAGILAATLGLPLSRARAGALLRGSILDAAAIRGREPEARLRIRLTLLAARFGLAPRAAAAWLAQRRFSRGEANEIASLVRLAGEASLPADADRRWGWVRDAGPRAGDALLAARLLHPEARDAVARHARAARSRRKPPRVRGEDVMTWLGIAPGSAIGDWLRDVEIAGLRGTVRTRKDARTWLTEQHREQAAGRTSPPAQGPPARK